MYYKRNTQSRSRNHCCRGKAIIITYTECVFRRLGFQHANRTRLLMLSVSCLALPLFIPHYLINSTIFGKKLLTIKCAF